MYKLTLMTGLVLQGHIYLLAGKTDIKAAEAPWRVMNLWLIPFIHKTPHRAPCTESAHACLTCVFSDERNQSMKSALIISSVSLKLVSIRLQCSRCWVQAAMHFAAGATHFTAADRRHQCSHYCLKYTPTNALIIKVSVKRVNVNKIIPL